MKLNIGALNVTNQQEPVSVDKVTDLNIDCEGSRITAEYENSMKIEENMDDREDESPPG